MNLRPREINKELAGQFRYQAKSNTEKVIDSYKQNYPLNSVENNEAFSSHLMKKHTTGEMKSYNASEV